MPKARSCRALAALLAALSVTALSGGCQFKGGGAPPRGPQGTGNTWAPVPVKMRVYPTTKFVRDGDRTLLEARVELLDEMGDSTKGVGRFSFELRAPQRARQPDVGERLYAWDVKVLTLDDQRSAYDPITRTYFFQLKVDSPNVARHATLLRAVFTTPDGRRIESQATIKGAVLPAP